MTKYRKFPVVVEAFQWKGNAEALNIFTNNQVGLFVTNEQIESGKGTISVKTLSGIMEVNIDDWVVRSKDGENTYEVHDKILTHE